jgi:hypothetical protein
MATSRRVQCLQRRIRGSACIVIKLDLRRISAAIVSVCIVLTIANLNQHQHQIELVAFSLPTVQPIGHSLRFDPASDSSSEGVIRPFNVLLTLRQDSILEKRPVAFATWHR